MLIISGNNINEIEKLKLGIRKVPLQYYFGTMIEYDRLKGEIKLSQHTNILRILKKLSMNDCNKTKTPMEKGLCLSYNSENEPTKI